MEIMVAAGLVGIISVAVMQMNKTMSRGQATAEAKMESIEIRRLIITNMSNKQACENTLGGTNLGGSVDKIRNEANRVLFNVGNKYGNNAIELESIKVEDDGDLGGGMRQALLKVRFKNLKKASYGAKTKSFETKLKVKAASATGTIDECFDDTSGVISTANETTCLAIGGVWEPSTSTCTISQFVLKAGDTMTGALTTPKLNADNVETDKVTSPSYCSGTECRAINELALANQSCPAGQVSFGIKADGTINCKPLQCPASQYFAGLDTAGNAVCRPYPTNTCPTNEYVTKVNSDGTVDCAPLPPTANATCPTGKVLQSINGGVATCVDQNNGGVPAAQSCPTGQAVLGFSSDGSLICGTLEPNVPNINCIGNFGTCVKSNPSCARYTTGSCNRETYVTCPGLKTYTILQPAAGNGIKCPYKDGEQVPCSITITIPRDPGTCL